MQLEPAPFFLVGKQEMVIQQRGLGEKPARLGVLVEDTYDWRWAVVNVGLCYDVIYHLP